MRILSILLLMLSCSKNKAPEKATVIFKFPKASIKAVAPKKKRADKKKTKTESITGLIPTTSSEFNCFGVFIYEPEQPQAGSCTLNNGSIVAPHTQFVGIIGPNATTLETTINVGTGRQFFLMGAVTLTGVCPIDDDDADTFDDNDLSHPYLLGSTTSDINSGINNVTLAGTFNASNQIDTCSGSYFVDDNTDPLCKSANNSLATSVVQFSAGDGTAGDPYLICNGNQLGLIPASSTDHFEIGDDISMSAYTGASWVPISNFGGSFDGRGFDIEDFTYSGSALPFGIFENVTATATITSMTIIDANIVNSAAVPSEVAGIVIGRVSGNGTNGNLPYISDIFVSGQISANHTNGGTTGTGGIIGQWDGDGIARRMLNDADVVVNQTARNNIGGVIGILRATAGSHAILMSSLANKGSIGNSSGNTQNYVGGIFGRVSSSAGTITMRNLYNTGAITGRANVGGIIGRQNSTYGTLSYAFNTGVVTSGASALNYAGGIYGRVAATGLNFLNLANFGNVYGGSAANLRAQIANMVSTGTASNIRFDSNNAASAAATAFNGAAPAYTNVSSADSTDFQGTNASSAITGWDATWEFPAGSFPTLSTLPD